MFVPAGEVIALGGANSRLPFLMEKLLKRMEPGISQLCGRGGQERIGAI